MHFAKSIILGLATLVATVAASPIAGPISASRSVDSDLESRSIEKRWAGLSCLTGSNNAAGLVTGIYDAIDTVCASMVGDQRTLLAGECVVESVEYSGVRMLGSIRAVEGSIIAHRSGCVDALRYIQESCKQYDSTSTGILFGGDIYTNAQTVRFDLWYL